MFNPILKILYVDFVQLFELIIYCFYLKHLVNGHCITDKERFITNTFSYFSINQFLLRHFLSFLIILPSYFFPTSFLFFPILSYLFPTLLYFISTSLQHFLLFFYILSVHFFLLFSYLFHTYFLIFLLTSYLKFLLIFYF